MISITLPDKSVKEYERPVSAAQVAADIGPGLAKVAVGARINGELVDLSTVMDANADLVLLTLPRKGQAADADVLFLLRHSCAHVMAEAIQSLFPGTQLVYGPATEMGFYYDMAMPDGVTLSANDFEAIEAEMKKIVTEDRPFTRVEMPVVAGLDKLRDEGSKYKYDNAERAVETGSISLSW